MKILVSGGSGLLGKEFEKIESEHKIIALPRNEFDVSDPVSVGNAIREIRPDAIINAAAMVNIDVCEQNEGACFAINEGGVSVLLKVLLDENMEGVRFVQISSSEVFGRIKEGEYEVQGYKEEDEPKPVTAYQRSKAAGEEALRKFAKAHSGFLGSWHIVRGGWLYGKGRETFFDAMARDLQEKNEVIAAYDQWRSPTPAKLFAKSVIDILEHFPSGVYHPACEVKEGEVTSVQAVEEVKKILGYKAKAAIKEVSRTELFTVPRAPSNVLKNTKIPPLPYWRDALRDYLASTD